MGGIRNREAKKKANNVFSGGSGGGTKGPSVIDKRNQELPCPHCDRVFKQKERYLNHLKTKHADEVADQEGGGDAADATNDPAAAAGPSEGADGKKGGMMKVGAKAGYYTSKSPRLLLIEQCQSEKRSSPRVKPQEKGGGKWGCKVVIPHPKKADLDIVVFVPDELHAEDRDEAVERGSLCALHAIAGHRSLERILPEMYRPMWARLGELKTEKDAKIEKREEIGKARAAREKRRRDQDLKNQLQALDVSISDDKLSLIQNLIRQGVGDGAAAAANKESSMSDDVATRLLSLGCTHDMVSAAASAGSSSYTEALDWLCIHVDHNDLPPALRGRSNARVKVIRAPSNSALEEPVSQDPATRRLCTLGYPAADAAAALADANGVPEAWLRLFNTLVPTAQAVPATPPDAGLLHAIDLVRRDAASASVSDDLFSQVGDDEALTGWIEELVVLESMFADELALATIGCVQLRVQLPPAPGVKSNEQTAIWLTVTVLVWPGCGYPERLPLFGVTCPALSSARLLEVTLRAAEELSASSLGEAMLPALYEAVKGALEGPAAPGPPTLGRLGLSGEATHDDSMDLTKLATSLPGRTRGRKGGRGRRPPQRSRSKIAEDTRKLQQILDRNDSAKSCAAMRGSRRALPAYSKRQDVIDAVRGHRVVVIRGAPGCGKSTQIPQYILEDEVRHGLGSATDIICTQPRRLAAVALATRVTDEMGPDASDVVGYSVRLASTATAATRLLFCTVGVLLRRLSSDPALSGVSHIVIDEVHERSLDSDLLMLLVRDTLAQNPALRLVLMSATTDAGIFQTYFDTALAQCRMVSGVQASTALVDIPGFTYPVREHHLEDVLQVTAFHRSAKPTSKRPDAGTLEALQALHADSGTSDWSAAYDEDLLKFVASLDESVINYDLIENLVAHVIAREGAEGPHALLEDWPGLKGAPDMGRKSLSGPGAILVFLPGSLEISKLQRQLTGSAAIARALKQCGGSVRVLPLHSGLPVKEQAAVFEHTGPRCWKVVLSTNVAETSITIDDVTTVIDSGKMKEMQFDATYGLSRLAEVWVSRAAATQRQGRAGRVRPGVCFRLFSRLQWSKLDAYQLPEMLRSPLEPVCLQIKSTLPGKAVAQVLAHCLTPPDPSAVDQALKLLHTRQLLTPEEELTPLGEHLTSLPLDPAVGKMLVYASMLQCTDPVLTVAASLGYGRPVFLSPPHARKEANEARARILGDALPLKSDHLAIVYAFSQWRRIRSEEGRQAAKRWCIDNFVSFDAMDTIHLSRVDYAQTLADIGFVSTEYVAAVRSGRDNDDSFSEDANASDARLVKATICAGFYPNILRVENPAARYTKLAGGNVQSEESDGIPKLFERVRGRVFMHPSSANMAVTRYETRWLVYTEMVQTSKVFVRSCSMIPVFALLLFGGALEVEHERNLVVVDAWARLSAAPRVGVLVRELRTRLDELLAFKLEAPNLVFSSHPIVKAMLEILRTDGM